MKKIKLFKTLLITVPCLVILVLIIIVMPKKEKYVLDEAGDLDAFADPQLVNNSSIGFFYRNEQLLEFNKKKMPDKASVIKMSHNIVTTDFTKNNISIVPFSSGSYIGPKKLIITNGKTAEYVSKTDSGFVLKSGAVVSGENAHELILDVGFFGAAHQSVHKLEKLKTYYAAFTQKSQAIYFEFTTDNEFASVLFSGLSGRTDWALLDSNFEVIKNGFSSKNSLEITYKGLGKATYYIKLTGSYKNALAPFSIRLPHDENEWNWKMTNTKTGIQVSGRFDYYGDQDYFVLPADVTSNTNKAALRFTSLSTEANVVVFDKNGKILAQYLYSPKKTEKVSFYALENAYAFSVYSFDGLSSGTSYSFVLEKVDSEILDIQTFGFALTPGYSEKENYYTASIATLNGKKITDVMATESGASVTIKVSQQCGKEVVAQLNKNLPLAPGRNTVTINISSQGKKREIIFVISHRAGEVYYGYTLGGEKVFIVDDKTKQNHTQIQKANGDYEWISNDKLFSYHKTTMPASYAAKINALKKTHPNWKFTFVKVGKDFNAYVKSQTKTDGGGTPLSTVDSKKASLEDITYYIDPRNFLNEKDIFMFEKQTYSQGAYSQEGVLSVWNNQNFCVYITEAAKSTGLSPYFITARAALESGRGTSPLATGKIPNYQGYYNFYGINAKNNAVWQGGLFAKEHNWNTKRKAIIEGAAWIKSDYIGSMQYTAYFMKFCFVKNREWHQYMTDIKAPYKDAQSFYKAHKNGGTLKSEIEFVIPVFENMP